MRRLFLIALMALLPFQFAWSAAAAYCQHEETSAASTQHFGHHQHVHADAAKKASSSKLSVDVDCGVCHAAGWPLPIANAHLQVVSAPTQRAASADTPLLPSGLNRAPDRPQWPRLS